MANNSNMVRSHMTKLVRTEWHAETIIAIEKREREGERERIAGISFLHLTLQTIQMAC